MLPVILVALMGPLAAPTGCLHSMEPGTTVCAYLAALEAMDHRAMIRYWGQDAVSVGADGRERPIDHDMMRKMRGFEKGMRTRWTFEIQQVSGADVTVSLSETSDFYDLLGVGKCSHVVVYTGPD